MIALALLIGTCICGSAVIILWMSSTATRAMRAAAVAALLVSAASYCYAAGAFEVRKLVGACVMPAGVLWIVWAVIAVVLSRRTRPMLTAAVWGLWLAYGAIGNFWVAQGLAGWLESDYSAIDPMKLPPFDAVLVLGGGIDVHHGGQIFLGNSGDRVTLGARLYLTGRTSTLITSGPPWPPPGLERSVPELTSIMWQELGVDAADIVRLEGPRTTGEEMQALADLMATRPWRRVGVLSCASHLRRAERLADRHDLEIIPLPAAFRSTLHSVRSVHLIPHGDAFSDVHRACWEIVGAAVIR